MHASFDLYMQNCSHCIQFVYYEIGVFRSQRVFTIFNKTSQNDFVNNANILLIIRYKYIDT